MNHDFKVGDMVLIVGAETDTQNIGKVAELIELIHPRVPSQFIMPNGVSAAHDGAEACWFMSGESLTQGDPEYDGFAMRHPKFLMPLKGDFAPDRQKEREVTA